MILSQQSTVPPITSKVKLKRIQIAFDPRHARNKTHLSYLLLMKSEMAGSNSTHRSRLHSDLSTASAEYLYDVVTVQKTNQTIRKVTGAESASHLNFTSYVNHSFYIQLSQ